MPQVYSFVSKPCSNAAHTLLTETNRNAVSESMIKIVLVTCLLSIAPIAGAQIPPVTLVGAGLKTCKEMGQINKEYPQFNALFNSWLQGYFSGLNFGLWADKRVDFLRDKVSVFA